MLFGRSLCAITGHCGPIGTNHTCRFGAKRGLRGGKLIPVHAMPHVAFISHDPPGCIKKQRICLSFQERRAGRVLCVWCDRDPECNIRSISTCDMEEMSNCLHHGWGLGVVADKGPAGNCPRPIENRNLSCKPQHDLGRFPFLLISFLVKN